jgi:hypothetical protein
MVVLQEDLIKIEEWIHLNKMKLCVNKCKVMCFSRKQNRTVMNLQICYTDLKEVISYKYLGVVLHQGLNWSEQVGRISEKATKNLNFVMRNLKGTKRLVKEKAYLAIIRPVLEYAGSVWDPYLQSNIKEIENVQRLAARRVLGRWKKYCWSEEKNGSRVRIFESPTEMVGELQ